MRFVEWGIFGLWALTACGPGTAAQVVRPPERTAAGALEEDLRAGAPCGKVAGNGEPLVVDWKTADQLDLTVAMQQGLAVVAYDCRALRLLKGCTLKGGYGYAGVGSVLQEAVKIEDADDVKASLPLSGASLGGEVQRGSAIDIALAYVGKRGALSDSATRHMLTGTCDGATHFVRAATIGAFVMEKGTRGRVRAAAEMFGAGASGSSSSAKTRLNSGGDINACKQTKDGARRPPDACSAVVRLELAPILDAHRPAPAPNNQDGSTLDNTCPEGFVPSDGHCAKKATAKRYRCDPNNREECVAQCDNGDADSCYNAGFATWRAGHLTREAAGRATTLFERACDRGSGKACTWLGSRHIAPDRPLGAPPVTGPLSDDSRKAQALLTKACDLLDAGGCDNLARYTLRGDFGKPDEEAAARLRDKACALGFAPSCLTLADAYLFGQGIAKDPARGTRMLDSSCDRGLALACKRLSDMFDPNPGIALARYKDQPKDNARSLAYLEKACERGFNDVRCTKK